MALVSDLKAIVINATKVLVKDGTASVGMGGFVNTPVLSGQVVVGFTRQGAAATLSFTSAVEAGTNVNNVFVVSNAQIRLIWDTGDEWLMTGASNTDPPELSGGSGDLAVTYNGKAWQQTKFAA